VRIGVVCNLLLGILRDGQPRHGYALAKDYERRTGLVLGLGNVYRKLRSLADGGLVHPVDNPAGADPRRLPHRITELGSSTFDDWFCRVPDASPGTSGELAARVAFLPYVPSELASRVIERARGSYLVLARKLENELEKSLRAQHTDVAAPHPILVRRRVRLIEAELAFLDEVGRTYALSHIAQPARNATSAPR
jgi:DNA-binding PadR family transcriptional regulator